jgi:hypothetical protein
MMPRGSWLRLAKGLGLSFLLHRQSAVGLVLGDRYELNLLQAGS